MAALTIIEIEKVLNGEYWVNRYFCSEAIGAADNTANAILNAERQIHFAPVTFTKMSLRTVTEGDEVYATAPINLPGLADLMGGQIMPLFVVARVDFQAQVGRPSRKYLRGVLDEAQVTTFDIGAPRVASINGNYASVVAALAGFCDIDGDDIIAGSVSPKVGMRQLRRGSKKKSVPLGGGTPV